ncbi:MAG: hypothetical protein ABI865_14945 [Nitrosospira sp.]
MESYVMVQPPRSRAGQRGGYRQGAGVAEAYQYCHHRIYDHPQDLAGG